MRKSVFHLVAVGALGLSLAVLSGCGGTGSTESGAPGKESTPAAIARGGAGTQLTGAGSTFDNPLFTKAFYEYHQSHSDVTVNYQSIGSGGGIKQFSAGTVDFGATDVPMNPKELSDAESQGGAVIQIPVTIGAEAIAYNLEGVPSGLKLTPRAIADIYLGKVKSWNDPEIAAANPGMKLPSEGITVVHRSDGSGTTYIFSDYLSAVSPDWSSRVGKGKSVNWPVGVGGKGNEGVAGLVQKTPGAIGYVELAYIMQTHMTAAVVQNADGKYLAPTLEGAKSAAATRPDVDPTHFSIVNARGQESYPISGYSWVLLYQKTREASHARALVDVMKWLVTDAQDSVSASLGYVPLPDNVRKKAATEIAKVQV